MLPVPAGFNVHVTPVFTALPTEAGNGCRSPGYTVVTEGVSVMVTGGKSVTTADADLVGSDWLVAVMVTVCGVVMVVGAVKLPEEDNVPMPAGALDQVTAELQLPGAPATNCCDCDAYSAAWIGEIVSVCELSAPTV